MSVKEKLYQAYEYARDTAYDAGVAAKNKITSIRKEDVVETIDSISGAVINGVAVTQRTCSQVWQWATTETPPAVKEETPAAEEEDADWEKIDKKTK